MHLPICRHLSRSSSIIKRAGIRGETGGLGLNVIKVLIVINAGIIALIVSLLMSIGLWAILGAKM